MLRRPPTTYRADIWQANDTHRQARGGLLRSIMAAPKVRFEEGSRIEAASQRFMEPSS
jgi:hypothetical protein